MNSTTSEPIRIFIGSSPKNIVEEKVFRYTLQKYTNAAIEVYAIDGQTGTATQVETGEVKELPKNVIGRIKGATAFSLARWAIPQWCNYQGRAIYCDSDQVTLTDISELWNFDLSGSPFAAVPVKQAKCHRHYVQHFLKDYLKPDNEYYLASVMLIDCEKTSVWNLETLVELLDQKQFSMSDLMYLGKGFREHFQFEVKPLPCEWNHLDYVDASSKIVHFTDLTRQPWRFHHHPIAEFWEQIFLESIRQGFLDKQDVIMACDQGWVTQRIKALALLDKPLPMFLSRLWRQWSLLLFYLIDVPKGVVLRGWRSLTFRWNHRFNVNSMGTG
jgi:lipopolysaccharide biosynthesis glycosyltransferase